MYPRHGSLDKLSRFETVSRQYFYCLGLGHESYYLGLDLGLDDHCPCFCLIPALVSRPRQLQTPDN